MPARTEIELTLGKNGIRGLLTVPEDASGLVVLCRRYHRVTQLLRESGLATFQCDLLTEEEEAVDRFTREMSFDVALQVRRWEQVAHTISDHVNVADKRVGFFTSGASAAGALIAASEMPHLVKAVVSLEGRVDLAEAALPELHAPTLLILRSKESGLLGMNETALESIATPEKRLAVASSDRPSHIGELARAWFHFHLSKGELSDEKVCITRTSVCL